MLLKRVQDQEKHGGYDKPPNPYGIFLHPLPDGYPLEPEISRNLQREVGCDDSRQRVVFAG